MLPPIGETPSTTTAKPKAAQHGQTKARFREINAFVDATPDPDGGGNGRLADPLARLQAGRIDADLARRAGTSKRDVILAV